MPICFVLFISVHKIKKGSLVPKYFQLFRFSPILQLIQSSFCKLLSIMNLSLAEKLKVRIRTAFYLTEIQFPESNNASREFSPRNTNIRHSPSQSARDILSFQIASRHILSSVTSSYILSRHSIRFWLYVTAIT